MSEDNSKKIDRILRQPLQRGAFDAVAAESSDTFKLTPHVPGRVITLGQKAEPEVHHG